MLRNFFFGKPKQDNKPAPAREKTDISYKNFAKRLTAIGYDTELVPSSFIDHIAFIMMNNPVLLSSNIQHSVDAETLPSIKNSDRPNQNPYNRDDIILLPKSFDLEAEKEKIKKDELKLHAFKYDQKNDTSHQKSEESDLDAMIKETEARIEKRNKLITQYENEMKLKIQMETFVSLREKIYALEQQLAKAEKESPANLEELLADSNLDPKVQAEFIQEQRRQYNEGVRAIKQELRDQLALFIFTTKETIESQAAKDGSDAEILVDAEEQLKALENELEENQLASMDEFKPEQLKEDDKFKEEIVDQKENDDLSKDKEEDNILMKSSFLNLMRNSQSPFRPLSSSHIRPLGILPGYGLGLSHYSLFGGGINGSRIQTASLFNNTTSQLPGSNSTGPSLRRSQDGENS
ncbi:GumC domain-containing protein [Aquicella lusitana]|uniref:Uncharacterized protein n=1 Tax=Aquicella lusitana TaxID=254246 RepID=A0A370GTE6_9COXI|nr:hypothetical protein [Aquicella lusitana]RDI45193.1 hypothetical protein C8D86_10772 [Aquicella lusitana]VVC72737.1 hypothetical protein AQULUS_04580 [Aquicella lusitana]